MGPKLFGAGLWLALAASVFAWEIKGKVTDRPGLPIAQARVCDQTNPSNCVMTDADGAFSLRGDASGIAASKFASSFSLNVRGGVFRLFAPHPVAGRLAWFDAGRGRWIGERSLGLSRGPNPLDPPAFSGAGVRFLRFRAEGLSLTWKVVLGGLVDFAALPAMETGPSGLGKTAAGEAACMASKTGFHDRVYFAKDSPLDSTAWILLATSADDTTYKVPGTSYPASAVPPNETLGRTEFWNCKHCYGGKKVAQLLGHSATGKGSFTFNKIHAPADGNYEVTWDYYCGTSDNNGDTDCGGDKTLLTKSGCRPGIFVVNGVELPKVYQFKCYPDSWNNVHHTSFSLPLKAGNANSIKIYSKSADAPDFDRIIVTDGR